MARFFELEGLTYHMDTLESYGAILRESGFTDVSLEDIHTEYRAMAHAELERLETDLAEMLSDRLGSEWQAHFVENWRAMTKVLDSGDLRPGRLRARKPEA